MRRQDELIGIFHGVQGITHGMELVRMFKGLMDVEMDLYIWLWIKTL